MAGNTSSPGASLVGRAFAVLGTFDDGHRRQALSQIAERAGLPAPTVLRIVRELVAAGALERGEDRRYAVGRRLWDLGLLAPAPSGLKTVASPFLHDLHAATRATVHLAVRDGDRVLYLDRIAGRASVPTVSRVGGRLPLPATGVGKVLLAHAPAEVQERVLGALERHTAYTVVRAGLLRAQLQRARRLGYATTREEMTLGACSIGVPIGDPRGTGSEPVGSLGVVVPDLRQQGRLVAALQVAASGIARALPARSGGTAADGW